MSSLLCRRYETKFRHLKRNWNFTGKMRDAISLVWGHSDGRRETTTEAWFLPVFMLIKPKISVRAWHVMCERVCVRVYEPSNDGKMAKRRDVDWDEGRTEMYKRVRLHTYTQTNGELTRAAFTQSRPPGDSMNKNSVYFFSAIFRLPLIRLMQKWRIARSKSFREMKEMKLKRLCSADKWRLFSLVWSFFVHLICQNNWRENMQANL